MIKKAKPAVRIILGLIFFVFGLNFFLNFIPMPQPTDPQLLAFTSGMLSSGYLFHLIKITEVVCGALLLANMYVPLALIILSPVVVNIFLVHTVLDRTGLPMALIIVLLLCANAYFYWNTFKPLLKKKN